MKLKRKIQIITSVLALALYGWLIQESGLLFNLFDHSMPAGIYQKVELKPTQGSLAVTCLKPEIAAYGLERGYLKKGRCSTGIEPVLKRVMAVECDMVTFENEGIKTNGEFLKGYRIAGKDSLGRPLKKFYSGGVYTLKEGEYWLMSDYKPNSWDSRYWGAVGVESGVKPVLLFPPGGLWKNNLSAK